MAAEFPNNPTNGQLFDDTFGVRWLYNDGSWINQGYDQKYPAVSAATAGLLNPRDRTIIDNYQEYTGGFGIIIDPKTMIATADNPTGIITGDIKLVSDSLDIDCITYDTVAQIANGITCSNAAACTITEPNITTTQVGLRVALSQAFLNNLYFQINGGAGSAGLQGPDGAPGRVGTGDGPVGMAGSDGANNLNPTRISGVRFVDSANIVDTAVVDIGIINGNKIILTSGKIRVADSTTPADQLVATQITRAVSWDAGAAFTDYKIISGGDSLPLDVTLAKLPDGVSNNPQQFSPINLTAFIDGIVGWYQQQLTTIDDTYLDQAKNAIEAADGEARKILNSIAGQLADCEMQEQPHVSIDLESCTPSNTRSFSIVRRRRAEVPHRGDPTSQLKTGARDWTVG